MPIASRRVDSSPPATEWPQAGQNRASPGSCSEQLVHQRVSANGHPERQWIAAHLDRSDGRTMDRGSSRRPRPAGQPESSWIRSRVRVDGGTGCHGHGLLSDLVPRARAYNARCRLWQLLRELVANATDVGIITGPPLIRISRMVPRVLASGLAWCVIRQLGAVALESSVITMSIFVTALTFRLMSEQICPRLLHGSDGRPRPSGRGSSATSEVHPSLGRPL